MEMFFDVSKTLFLYHFRIYNLQDQGYTYSSVENLLSAMNPQFVNMTKFTSLSHLKEKQISDKFINEIFAAVVRTNYGQTSDVNSFVGRLKIHSILLFNQLYDAVFITEDQL